MTPDRAHRSSSCYYIHYSCHGCVKVLASSAMGSYCGLHVGFSTNTRGEEPWPTMELCSSCCCSTVIFFSHYFLLLPSSVPTSHTSRSCAWTDGGGKHNYALHFRARRKIFFPYSDVDLLPTMMSTIHTNPIAPLIASY